MNENFVRMRGFGKTVSNLERERGRGPVTIPFEDFCTLLDQRITDCDKAVIDAAQKMVAAWKSLDALGWTERPVGECISATNNLTAAVKAHPDYKGEG